MLRRRSRGEGPRWVGGGRPGSGGRRRARGAPPVRRRRARGCAPSERRRTRWPGAAITWLIRLSARVVSVAAWAEVSLLAATSALTFEVTAASAACDHGSGMAARDLVERLVLAEQGAHLGQGLARVLHRQRDQPADDRMGGRPGGGVAGRTGGGGGGDRRGRREARAGAGAMAKPAPTPATAAASASESPAATACRPTAARRLRRAGGGGVEHGPGFLGRDGRRCLSPA